MDYLREEDLQGKSPAQQMLIYRDAYYKTRLDYAQLNTKNDELNLQIIALKAILKKKDRFLKILAIISSVIAAAFVSILLMYIFHIHG